MVHIVVDKMVGNQLALVVVPSSSLVVELEHQHNIALGMMVHIVVDKMVDNRVVVVVVVASSSLVELGRRHNIVVDTMVHIVVGKMVGIQLALVVASSSLVVAEDSTTVGIQLGKIEVGIVVDKLVELAFGRFEEEGFEP